MSKFTHLHNHFDVGSPRDATTKIKDTVKKAKEMGFKAYAITEHGRIEGWVPFNMACKQHNIKGLYGVELYEANRRTVDKEAGVDDVRFHSVMIARNEKGIKFLQRLVTHTLKRENIYYMPRYDLDYLKKHKSEITGNVIWLSGCINGRLPRLLLQGQKDKAKKYVETMADIFGHDSVFVEIQDHGIEDERMALPLLIQFARENGYPLVATNDVHYLEKEHHLAREIMIARERGETIAEREAEGKFLPPELYLKSEDEMMDLFRFVPDAIENTQKIVDMCEDIDLEGKKWHFPQFEIPKGYTEDSYMKKLVMERLPEKYPITTMTTEKVQELKDRIELEVQTISNMNTSAYMLIDSDFIVWAKDRDIKVGPGRGSACGSVVAYLLGITDVDPLPYGLYFERFMNPERVSMPDIDTDFQDDRRAEVIEYVVNKYGADKVAQILTFGTIGARMAIRDVGAVFEIDAKLVDRIAKAVPAQPGITIDKALESNPKLKEEYNQNPIVKGMIDKAKMIEGLVRQTGVHAAGVIIADAPLTEYGALMEVEDSDIPVFLGDMKAVEYKKLLKMDFLGLRTLTVIKDCVDMVEEVTGRRIDVDSLLFDDPEVFKYISMGETEGVFQLEQPGMQKFMKELQPNNIEDLILGISVYRPGPMDNIPALIKGKRSPDTIQYPNDAAHLLAPILDITYGIMVYQEQVMQIVRDLAGYSFGRSDLVRRAMAKKKHDIMEAERNVFVYGEVKCPECQGSGKQANGDNCVLCRGEGVVACRTACPWCKGDDANCSHCHGTGIIESSGEVTVEGCVRRGISEKTANALFDEMIVFSSYAFNKSHATAYAVLGYQTAFLKYYYPRQYMTAYLNSVISDQKKVRKYIGIAKKMGLPLLRPDINKCQAKFIQNKNGIYMGLTSLKYVGTGVQEAIKERTKNGEFKDLQDLLERVSLNKREVESLIKSGALDCFGHKRSQMLSSLDVIIKGAKVARESREAGQMSLFDFADKETKKAFRFQFPNIAEYNPMEKFSMEKEVSGFYLSGHPLELPEYQPFTKRSNITTVDNFIEADNRKNVRIVGIIQIDEKEGGFKISKAGKQYAVFDIEDKYSTISVLAFEKCLEKSGFLIQAGNIVELSGTLSVQVNEFVDESGEVVQSIDVKIFANNIKALSEIDQIKKVYIRIDRKTAHCLTHIRQLATQHPGADELYIYNSDDKKILKFNKTFGYNDHFHSAIRKFISEDSLAIR